MANVRNYEEYRAEVLDRLGDDYTVEDLRNTERWRLHVLDMLSGGGSGGGGSSDFSTAKMTINKGKPGAPINCIMPWFSEEDNETNAFLTLDELTESWTVKVPVGGSFISVYFSRAPQSVSGDIQSSGDITILSKTFKSYVITGDCTISFS